MKPRFYQTKLVSPISEDTDQEDNIGEKATSEPKGRQKVTDLVILNLGGITFLVLKVAWKQANSQEELANATKNFFCNLIESPIFQGKIGQKVIILFILDIE